MPRSSWLARLWGLLGRRVLGSRVKGLGFEGHGLIRLCVGSESLEFFRAFSTAYCRVVCSVYKSN